jgi:hypothetical protein
MREIEREIEREMERSGVMTNAHVESGPAAQI